MSIGYPTPLMGLYIGVDKNFAPSTFFSGLIDDVHLQLCSQSIDIREENTRSQELTACMSYSLFFTLHL